MQKKSGTKKKATKKRKPARRASKELGLKDLMPDVHQARIKKEMEFREKLFGAIEESLHLTGEQLQRDPNDPRKAANRFLVCVSHRFDKIVPQNFHEEFGYDHAAAEVESNIVRLSRNLSRRSLEPAHGRLDTVLNDLVHEALRLAKSQDIFCELCEHCLRKRYPDGDQYLVAGESFSTEHTLDDAAWAHVLEVFSHAFHDTEGEPVLAVALRHIESLAWVSRPGAVKEAVNQLLDSMVSASTDKSELRKEYEANNLAWVKEGVTALAEDRA
jgi:hypothetical protein